MNKQVVVAGTFDILHKGHKALLRKSFTLGEVTIGLTSNVFAENTKKRKVNGFSRRKKELTDFVRKEFKIKPKIIKIEDKFGFALEKDFDYIVVSPATYPTAVLINRQRRKINKKPIKIAKIKFILDENGKPISATEMLKEAKLLFHLR